MRKGKPRKPLGRKKIRRNFTETKLGFYLQHKTPLEFSLIMKSSGSSAPSANLIESLSYISLDPYFKTPQFRRALIEYRLFGLYPKRPVKPQLFKELRYIEYRKKRIEEEKIYSEITK